METPIEVLRIEQSGVSKELARFRACDTETRSLYCREWAQFIYKKHFVWNAKTQEEVPENQTTPSSLTAGKYQINFLWDDTTAEDSIVRKERAALMAQKFEKLQQQQQQVNDSSLIDQIIEACQSWMALPSGYSGLPDLFEPIEFNPYPDNIPLVEDPKDPSHLLDPLIIERQALCLPSDCFHLLKNLTGDILLSHTTPTCNHVRPESKTPTDLDIDRAIFNEKAQDAVKKALAELTAALEQAWGPLNGFLERLSEFEKRRTRLMGKGCQATVDAYFASQKFVSFVDSWPKEQVQFKNKKSTPEEIAKVDQLFENHLEHLKDLVRDFMGQFALAHLKEIHNLTTDLWKLVVPTICEMGERMASHEDHKGAKSSNAAKIGESLKTLDINSLKKMDSTKEVDIAQDRIIETLQAKVDKYFQEIDGLLASYKEGGRSSLSGRIDKLNNKDMKKKIKKIESGYYSIRQTFRYEVAENIFPESLFCKFSLVCLEPLMQEGEVMEAVTIEKEVKRFVESHKDLLHQRCSLLNDFEDGVQTGRRELAGVLGKLFLKEGMRIQGDNLALKRQNSLLKSMGVSTEDSGTKKKKNKKNASTTSTSIDQEVASALSKQLNSPKGGASPVPTKSAVKTPSPSTTASKKATPVATSEKKETKPLPATTAEKKPVTPAPVEKKATAPAVVGKKAAVGTADKKQDVPAPAPAPSPVKKASASVPVEKKNDNPAPVDKKPTTPVPVEKKIVAAPPGLQKKVDVPAPVDKKPITPAPVEKKVAAPPPGLQKKADAAMPVDKKPIAPAPVEKKAAAPPPGLQKKVDTPMPVDKKPVTTTPAPAEKKVAAPPPGLQKKVDTPIPVDKKPTTPAPVEKKVAVAAAAPPPGLHKKVDAPMPVNKESATSTPAPVEKKVVTPPPGLQNKTSDIAEASPVTDWTTLRATVMAEANVTNSTETAKQPIAETNDTPIQDWDALRAEVQQPATKSAESNGWSTSDTAVNNWSTGTSSATEKLPNVEKSEDISLGGWGAPLNAEPSPSVTTSNGWNSSVSNGWGRPASVNGLNSSETASTKNTEKRAAKATNDNWNEPVVQDVPDSWNTKASTDDSWNKTTADTTNKSWGKSTAAVSSSDSWNEQATTQSSDNSWNRSANKSSTVDNSWNKQRADNSNDWRSKSNTSTNDWNKKPTSSSNNEWNTDTSNSRNNGWNNERKKNDTWQNNKKTISSNSSSQQESNWDTGKLSWGNEPITDASMAPTPTTSAPLKPSVPPPGLNPSPSAEEPLVTPPIFKPMSASNLQEPLPANINQMNADMLLLIVKHLHHENGTLIHSVYSMQQEMAMMTKRYAEIMALAREREAQTLALYESRKQTEMEEARRYVLQLEARLKQLENGNQHLAATAGFGNQDLFAGYREEMSSNNNHGGHHHKRKMWSKNNVVRCGNCAEYGHESADCKAFCRYCGSDAHLSEACPMN